MTCLPEPQDMTKQCSAQTTQRYFPGCQKQRLMETNYLEGCWGTWDVLTQVTGPVLRPPVVQRANTGVWPEDLATEVTSATSVLQLGSSPSCSPVGCCPMSHTGIWQRAHGCSASRPQEICPPPDIWPKLVLRIPNYFWSQFRLFKFVVTELKATEMFTGRPALRAVSCLNQWLTLFVLFYFKSQNQFPTGNLPPHQQGWPHDLSALATWNTPRSINDTGLGTSLWQRGHLPCKPAAASKLRAGNGPRSELPPKPCLGIVWRCANWLMARTVPGTDNHTIQPGRSPCLKTYRGTI